MSDIVQMLRSFPHVNGAVLIPVGVVAEAADTIERLRSLAGKAGVGPSFSDMTSELRHQTPAGDPNGAA